MNGFRERLQQAATWAGVGDSQATISSALGLNRQTINRWFQGGEPNADMLLHVARTLGVDAEWLKSAKGDMLPKLGSDPLPADEARAASRLPQGASGAPSADPGCRAHITQGGCHVCRGHPASARP